MEKGFSKVSKVGRIVKVAWKEGGAGFGGNIHLLHGFFPTWFYFRIPKIGGDFYRFSAGDWSFT